jgi:hypothetical protein
VLQSQSFKVHVGARREVWRDHLFIDLGVGWDLSEKGCQLCFVELANLLDGEDARVLGDNVEMVLQAWNLAFLLPVVLDGNQMVWLDVQHLGVVECVGHEIGGGQLGVGNKAVLMLTPLLICDDVMNLASILLLLLSNALTIMVHTHRQCCRVEAFFALQNA